MGSSHIDLSVSNMMDRREALNRYKEHKTRGLVDDDIIPLLDKINRLKCCYTTSSCSGRIALLQLPEIGDKKNAVFIGKWHRKVEADTVLNAVKQYKKGYLFLLVQSSIIHIVCEKFENTMKMITIARDAGFKYTSIKSIKDEKFLIEILSTENLHIPLGMDGNTKVDEKTIIFFVNIANKMLERIKRKLKVLEEKISSPEHSFCT